ncbi:MAG: dipeptidyl-peptidase-4 [Planctomycetota bacterium]|jgi:dipeptidyl-peptidase-4
MRLLSAAFLACVLSSFVSAQAVATQEKVEIQLAQAAMQPFAFIGQGLNGIKWHPNGKTISYLKMARRDFSLAGINAADGTESVLVAGVDFKAAAKGTGLTGRSLGAATWSKDGKSLRLIGNGKVHHYDIAKKAIRSGLSFPSEAEASTWSKDDAHIAFSKDKDVFVSKPDGSTFQVTRGGFDDLAHGLAVSRVEFGITDGMWWDPTGRRLAFYREDLRPIQASPLIDWAPTPAKVVPNRYPMAGRPGSVVTVGVYDTRDDSVTWLKTDTNVDQYLTNVTWGLGGETLYIAHVNRGQNTMDLKTWDATTGAFKKTLFTEKDEQWIEPEHGPIFLPDGNGDFLWFSYREGFQNLYLCNANGKFLQRVTNGDWDVSAFQSFADDLSKIYFVGAGDKPTESHLFSAPLIPRKTRDLMGAADSTTLAVVKEPATKLTDGRGQHAAVASPGHKHFYDEHSNLNQPLKTEICTVGGKNTITVKSNPNPWEKYQGGTEEMFTIKAQDGSDLHGHLVLPPNLDETKKYPVLLYVYGGPHAQLIKDEFGGGAGYSAAWYHYMACQGIIVIRLDCHGTPQRGIEFMQKIHRNMGTIEVQDQIAGLEYLFKRPYVDRSRVGVHGWSYGGFMTLSLMTRAGDYFKCGISGAPVTDWAYYETGYGERYMDTPEENPQGYKNSKPASHLDGLKGRLLVVQGSSDVTVVWQHTMAFLTACIEQNKPVEYMTYPGQLHGLRGKNRWHFYQKMTKFFLEELKGS